MAENFQQFGTREDIPTRRTNEVNISWLQEQLVELTSIIPQMAVGNMWQVKACEICKDVSYPTDGYPMLQDDNTEQINMAGDVPTPHRQYNPYSNMYNLGWRDHPNFSYEKNKQNSFPIRQQRFQPQHLSKFQLSSSNPKISLEDFVKTLAANTCNSSKTPYNSSSGQRRLYKIQKIR